EGSPGVDPGMMIKKHYSPEGQSQFPASLHRIPLQTISCRQVSPTSDCMLSTICRMWYIPEVARLTHILPCTYPCHNGRIYRIRDVPSPTLVICRVTDVMAARLKMGNSRLGCSYALRKGKSHDKGFADYHHSSIDAGADQLRLRWRTVQQQSSAAGELKLVLAADDSGECQCCSWRNPAVHRHRKVQRRQQQGSDRICAVEKFRFQRCQHCGRRQGNGCRSGHCHCDRHLGTNA